MSAGRCCESWKNADPGTDSICEDALIKYFWSAAGYSLMSIPILFRETGMEALAPGHSAVAVRTESMYRGGREDWAYNCCKLQAMSPTVACSCRWRTLEVA